MVYTKKYNIMFTFIKKVIIKLKAYYSKKKLEKKYKERLNELKKRDPFIYKH